MREDELTLDSEPVNEYVNRIAKAQNIQELKETTEEFKWCAVDAYNRAKVMTVAEFETDFMPGLKKERAGIFAGDDWNTKYGCIIMPKVMVQISLAVEKFRAPFSVVWHRAKKLGAI